MKILVPAAKVKGGIAAFGGMPMQLSPSAAFLDASQLHIVCSRRPFHMSLIKLKSGRPKMPVGTGNSLGIFSNDDIDEELESKATVVDLIDLIKPRPRAS